MGHRDPVFLVHLMACGDPTGISIEMVVLAIASYYLRMLAITAGYHRYFPIAPIKQAGFSSFSWPCLP